MKKKIYNPQEVKVHKGQLMTRKQAIKRGGYMSLSAVTMMILLNNNANGQPKGSPAAPSTMPKSPEKPDGIWND